VPAALPLRNGGNGFVNALGDIDGGAMSAVAQQWQ
jgi:hypothetical protein